MQLNKESFLNWLHPIYLLCIEQFFLSEIAIYGMQDIISYRRRSQKFQNWNFLHVSEEAHFPKGIMQISFQCELKAIFT